MVCRTLVAVLQADGLAAWDLSFSDQDQTHVPRLDSGFLTAGTTREVKTQTSLLILPFQCQTAALKTECDPSSHITGPPYSKGIDTLLLLKPVCASQRSQFA